MLITEETSLKAIKIYLPYVVIISLAWVNMQQFKINQALNTFIISAKDKDIEDRKTEMLFWRDAFIKTSEATNQAYNTYEKDSSSTSDSRNNLISERARKKAR